MRGKGREKKRKNGREGKWEGAGQGGEERRGGEGRRGEGKGGERKREERNRNIPMSQNKGKLLSNLSPLKLRRWVPSPLLCLNSELNQQQQEVRSCPLFYL